MQKPNQMLFVPLLSTYITTAMHQIYRVFQIQLKYTRPYVITLDHFNGDSYVTIATCNILSKTVIVKAELNDTTWRKSRL